MIVSWVSEERSGTSPLNWLLLRLLTARGRASWSRNGGLSGCGTELGGEETVLSSKNILCSCDFLTLDAIGLCLEASKKNHTIAQTFPRRNDTFFSGFF